MMMMMTSLPGLRGRSRLQVRRRVLQTPIDDRRQTTDDDGHQRPFLVTVWPPYTMCRRASNNVGKVYGAVIIERVHPVHLMNADYAPDGRQPSDPASQL